MVVPVTGFGRRGWWGSSGHTILKGGRYPLLLPQPNHLNHIFKLTNQQNPNHPLSSRNHLNSHQTPGSKNCSKKKSKMAITLYSITIPVFLKNLRTLKKLLEKGTVYAKDAGNESSEEKLVGAKLIEDMGDLVYQSTYFFPLNFVLVSE